MSQDKEKDVMVLPKDIEMIKYMLETAELAYDEVSPNDVDSQIILDNGITLSFTEDGMLLGIGEE